MDFSFLSRGPLSHPIVLRYIHYLCHVFQCFKSYEFGGSFSLISNRDTLGFLEMEKTLTNHPLNTYFKALYDEYSSYDKLNEEFESSIYSQIVKPNNTPEEPEMNTDELSKDEIALIDEHRKTHVTPKIGKLYMVKVSPADKPFPYLWTEDSQITYMTSIRSLTEQEWVDFGMPIPKEVELYNHIQTVAKASGFISITEAIGKAVDTATPTIIWDTKTAVDIAEYIHDIVLDGCATAGDCRGAVFKFYQYVKENTGIIATAIDNHEKLKKNET